jgi:hypothetical protein
VRDSQFKQIRVRRASVIGELSVRQVDWILRLKPVDLDNLPKYRAIVGGLHNQAQGKWRLEICHRQPKGFPIR